MLFLECGAGCWLREFGMRAAGLAKYRTCGYEIKDQVSNTQLFLVPRKPHTHR